MLLRSKLLVQVEEEPVPETKRLRDSLVRVKRRRHAWAVAGWLERRPQLGREVFARGAPEGEVSPGGRKAGDLLDLLLACFDLLDAPVPGLPRRQACPTCHPC